MSYVVLECLFRTQMRMNVKVLTLYIHTYVHFKFGKGPTQNICLLVFGVEYNVLGHKQIRFISFVRYLVGWSSECICAYILDVRTCCMQRFMAGQGKILYFV